MKLIIDFLSKKWWVGLGVIVSIVIGFIVKPTTSSKVLIQSGSIEDVWTPLTTYTITFHVNNGSMVGNPQTFTSGTSVILDGGIPIKNDANTPNRTSYRFTNWNTAANGIGTIYSNGDIVTFTSNITLYAQYEVMTYTVYFNANGGIPGNMETYKTFTSGKRQALNAGLPTRAGFIFTGWSLDSSSTVAEHYNNDNINCYGDNETFKLYAVWTPVKYR